MTGIALAVAVLLVALWAVTRFHLRGDDLSAFDRPTGRRFSHGPTPSDEHRAVVASLGALPSLLKDVPRSRQIPLLRKYMDDLFPVDEIAATATPVDAGGVPAEWVLLPGADPDRRVLYIHGGGFTMGSPRSHRRLTARFAEMSGGAVLAIDYRLMPEHRRMAGIEDCRAAYRWMLDNGPNVRAPAAKVWVAGDSAGGNLTLSLIAWARDSGLRPPDGAVAFSPLTDSTLCTPSLRANLATDPMLAPLFGWLAKLPRPLLLWFTWLQNRISPNDPVVSPARGELSRLPPVLVQASEAEMLRDDSRRYVNRAVAAGSPVQLQSWDHMVHVWHIFYPELAEGREALDEVRKFLAAT
jgi:acetyl esterase/lipase